MNNKKEKPMLFNTEIVKAIISRQKNSNKEGIFPSTKSQKNTKISYLYRDGSNYKQWNEVVVSGTLTETKKSEIFETLSDGEFFIPSQVGLPENRVDEYWTEDDHIWFELPEEGLTETDENTTEILNAQELYKNFKEINGKWDDSLSAVDAIMDGYMVKESDDDYPEPDD